MRKKKKLGKVILRSQIPYNDKIDFKETSVVVKIKFSLQID